MSKLVIVESPAKAKTIQKYLGDEYIVKSSMGHIVDLAKGGKFGIGVDVNDNFKPHYKIMDDKIQILDDLINCSEKCDEIYLVSDADIEGEAISYHLKEYLKYTKKPIKRAVILEITKNGIKDGLSKLRDIDLNLFKAQETRRILDRIVGFRVSPFLMNFFGSNLSAGRVQSVAVRIIVDREKEINNFVPQEYWNMFLKLKNKNNEDFVVKLENKVKTKQEMEKIQEHISSNDFFVLKVESKDKKEKPPEPLITSKLQQFMAKKYSMDAERTMKAAQSLYENGYCTYIRTDSVRISDDSLELAREWLKNNNFDIPKKSNKYENKDSSHNAHECIRPTKFDNLSDFKIFSDDEKLVYKTIWQFFMASQMNNAIYSTLSVKVSLKSNTKLIFKASGRSLKDFGYLKLFKTSDNSKIDIPNLTKNEELFIFDNNSVKVEQKFTQPPPRFSHATLLKELEDNGIGRPSTYATILKKITDRNYVELNNNIYKPTNLGIKITDILIKYFPFMDYNYTSDLEKKLDDISGGKINSLDVLNNFFSSFKDSLGKAYNENGSKICDKCKGPAIVRKTSDNKKYISCINFPYCRYYKIFEDV